MSLSSVSVENLMNKFNEYLLDTLDSEVPYYNEIIKYLHDNRGKQIRSRLSLLCALLGGELNSRSYRAAMVVEMLHTASLLHDDIVDSSKERRGVPSINNKWGNKIALFTGDIISLKALLLILSNKNYDIFKVYGEAVEKIVEGEFLQLKKTFSLNMDEETYFKIIESKTAAFFSAACEAGAISTFTNEAQIKQLSLFGEYIGIAFQIKDDLFGFSKNNVGKPADNDFKEKKITLPLIYTLKTIERKKKRKIKRIFKNKHIRDSEIEYIIEEVQVNGGIDYAKTKMREYIQKAICILQEFPDSEVRSELEKLVGFTTERDY
jgi:octaprenyl-diphosphate synthase